MSQITYILPDFLHRVCLEDIRTAYLTIASTIIRTPLVRFPYISDITRANVYLKLETHQKSGSFKIRGVSNKILTCYDRMRYPSIIAASTGNHALAVAAATSSTGIPTTIVMPYWSTKFKRETIRSLGATVKVFGHTLEESIGNALELVDNDGGLFIHPFDDVDIIAGHGTIALEIFEDMPETDMIVVPIGGGGLISGVATAAKAINKGVVVIGARATDFLSVVESSEIFKQSNITHQNTVADGICVTKPGVITGIIIDEFVDQKVLASELEIEKAMVLLHEKMGITAEGAGAVPLAAILNGSISIKAGTNVVLVISGGNVDPDHIFWNKR